MEKVYVMQLSRVVFKNFDEIMFKTISELFRKLKDGKEVGSIDESGVKAILGQLYFIKFWHPTQDELKKFKEQWLDTPPEKRGTHPGLKRPWDFGSWIDAIQNADITLNSVDRINNSEGQITFYQNSWPCGGLEALEYIITAANATIVATAD